LAYVGKQVLDNEGHGERATGVLEADPGQGSFDEMRRMR
jgi:hypothetical protein